MHRRAKNLARHHLCSAYLRPARDAPLDNGMAHGAGMRITALVLGGYCSVGGVSGAAWRAWRCWQRLLGAPDEGPWFFRRHWPRSRRGKGLASYEPERRVRPALRARHPQT